MAPAFDAFMFDLDGTLWETSGPVVRAWRSTLERMGYRSEGVTPEAIAGVMGLPYAEILDRLLPHVRAEERGAVADACYREECVVIAREGATLYPGVREGLPRLAAVRPLHLVSNCEPDYLELFLERSGLRPCFAAWTCHGATGLPKGENLRQLVERYGLRNPVYVGDTPGDRAAARSASMAFVQATWGFAPPLDGCVRAGCFDELVALLLGEPAAARA